MEGFVELAQVLGRREVTAEDAARNRKVTEAAKAAGRRITPKPLRPRPAVPALLPISKSSWWAGVAAGRYLRPIRVGRRSLWRAPLLVASRLSGNQRHEDALRWYHYIFNPTNPVAEVGKQRYWITKPFYTATEPEMLDRRIEDVLKKVNQRLTAYEQQVQAWRDNPFDPHIVASMRWVAYQKCVVMAYLDNLIAWGDRLFREERRESINEATQVYILAADILGSRPRRVPALGRKDRRIHDLEADLDKFGNSLVEVENTLPQVTIGNPTGLGAEPLPRLETFYFCIPANEKLLKYWEDVGHRLWNIRHCRNIEGIERPLALWDPPIDPE